MITTLGCLIMYLIIIVQAKDGALVHFKSEFPVIELEIQVLVKLAEEIAKSDIPVGSRRINGRYIQSHLFSGLEVLHPAILRSIESIVSRFELWQPETLSEGHVLLV